MRLLLAGTGTGGIGERDGVVWELDARGADHVQIVRRGTRRRREACHRLSNGIRRHGAGPDGAMQVDGETTRLPS